MGVIGLRHSSNFCQRRGVGDDPAGIVRAREDDEPGSRRHRRTDAVGIEGEAVSEIPDEVLHMRTEQAGSSEKRIVAGRLDQHLVARLEERRTREEVCPGCALCGSHLRRAHAAMPGDRFDQGCVAVFVGAVNGERVAGARQVVDRERKDVTAGEVEAWGRAFLRPLEVRRHGVRSLFSQLSRDRLQRCHSEL
jgi:hypothetical protein